MIVGKVGLDADLVIVRAEWALRCVRLGLASSLKDKRRRAVSKEDIFGEGFLGRWEW